VSTTTKALHAVTALTSREVVCPARGESLESAARALGVRLCGRRDAAAQEAGLVVCELHNSGERGVLAVRAEAVRS
jgi:hypothetical protein